MDTLSEVLGKHKPLQEALDEFRYGDKQLLKLHICFGDIARCPAQGPEGERWFHSCLWRRRYPVDISQTRDAWIDRNLTAEDLMLSADPRILRTQLGTSRAKIRASEVARRLGKADPIADSIL